MKNPLGEGDSWACTQYLSGKYKDQIAGVVCGSVQFRTHLIIDCYVLYDLLNVRAHDTSVHISETVFLGIQKTIFVLENHYHQALRRHVFGLLINECDS